MNRFDVNDRSIELEDLARILAVKEDLYTIDVCYKKLPQGGYVSEYKLSITESPNHDRISRFQALVNV